MSKKYIIAGWEYNNIWELVSVYKDEEEHTFYGVSARVDYQKISIKITDCIRG